MGIRSILSQPLSFFIAGSIRRDAHRPVECQDNVFKALISKGQHSIYGKAHRFKEIKSYTDFKKHVAVCDYEDLRPFIERITGVYDTRLFCAA